MEAIRRYLFSLCAAALLCSLVRALVPKGRMKSICSLLCGVFLAMTALSGLAESPIRYIVDDCKKFVEREIRRGNKYDAVIMDPPSYGRGPSGEVWKLEESIDPLIRLTTGVLSDEPLFFLVNSYTTGLSPSCMGYLLHLAMARYNGRVDSDEIGLPVSSTGAVLPCGSSSRWSAK